MASGSETDPEVNRPYDDESLGLVPKPTKKGKKKKGGAKADPKGKGKAVEVEVDELSDMEPEMRAEEPQKKGRKKGGKAPISPGAPSKESVGQRAERIGNERDALKDEMVSLRAERDRLAAAREEEHGDEFGGSAGLVLARRLGRFGGQLDGVESRLRQGDVLPGPASGPTELRISQTEIKKFLAMDHKVLQAVWCNLCVRRTVAYPGSDCHMQTGVSCTYCMKQKVGCVELGVSPGPFRERSDC